MEKVPLREEEIKELEDEIDLAVDRLFVEKKKGANEPSLQPSPSHAPALESSFEPALEASFEPSLEPSFESSEKLGSDFDAEQSFTVPPSPPPAPPSYLKSIDQLEAQLLALEWEITEEKLQKTQEAVRSLNQLLKQRSDVGSVLGFMDDVLAQMMADAEKIRPPMIKFLMDAKETIKLLLRKETEGDLSVYKQLALDGMEGRFGGLAGLPGGDDRKGARSEPTPLPVETGAFLQPSVEWEKVEEMFGQWKVFSGRVEETLRQISERLSAWEKVQTNPSSPSESNKPRLLDVTIFRTYGKCYGVESQRVFKLFKLPRSFEEKYGHQPKVRLQEFDVNLIDLRRTFPDETWTPGGAAKLLMIRGEGTYKGLMAEGVVKRLRVSLEGQRESEKPLLGTFHWIYESHPVEVPILDPERI